LGKNDRCRTAFRHSTHQRRMETGAGRRLRPHDAGGIDSRTRHWLDRRRFGRQYGSRFCPARPF